ncbi:DNA primase [Brachybacterium faecium]|uniref:DNA primase n=1 Tax=Brachybacterium faecium (strain ATCC 43885 / DSM 4810 / JCM 11609 / LMG 19847 / NBRC 14762 / NCIMB 9860 / 6-10) TaxID=446465 RepID=C7MD61_BRAFD|nr:DNA primase [Brachybacterium faecium]ACU85518.1 DNA primase [Brachybacterium faecium DSM 4810]SLN05138.1 DNA primase [Brachybacterium faecium]
MAQGLIRRSDVDLVRERARLDEVVSEHVTLRTAGIGSMKGLCPFHDEKTPSFNIRPQLGHWHCFGCGEGGDVISFVQKINHLSFVEAVEMLAGRYGVQLQYEDAGQGRGNRPDFGTRRRLLDAHAIAEEYYREQLGTPAAEVGRRFLTERGFDQDAAAHFGVGFAPEGWDSLTGVLRSRGFTEAELTASGLVSQGQRGVYDRFRGRLVWPIRDITGNTIGFGARRLLDSDQGPKYLNTPETAIYHKSSVLYGLDIARKAISSQHRVVVVEGYTDVMAAHLAGVTTAVASCGTAFGAEHVKIVRRVMGDSNPSAGLRLNTDGRGLAGEVVFTFDGDAAGQKAALRAFEEDQRFVAQTYVAVEASGMDPCELRIAQGDQAVRDLIETRRPLFEFAIRTAISQVDLDTVEGQVTALRMAAPVVARIRDRAMRPEYARRLSGWLGMDEATVLRAVHDAARSQGRAPQPATPARTVAEGQGGAGQGSSAEDAPIPSARLADVVSPRDPVGQVETQSLAVMLQSPQLLEDEKVASLPDDAFHVPALQGVWDVMLAAGTLLDAVQGRLHAARYLEQVLEIAGETVRPLIVEIANLDLPARDEEGLRRLAHSLLDRLTELSITREYSVLKQRLQRTDPSDAERYQDIMARLAQVQGRRRALRASGE